MLLAAFLPLFMLALPTSYAQDASLALHIKDSTDFVSGWLQYMQSIFTLTRSRLPQCLMLPVNRESIGDAEREGGMKAYCTFPRDNQGLLAPDTFTNNGPHFVKGYGAGEYVQVTGCLDLSKLSMLDPTDDGG